MGASCPVTRRRWEKSVHLSGDRALDGVAYVHAPLVLLSPARGSAPQMCLSSAEQRGRIGSLRLLATLCPTQPRVPLTHPFPGKEVLLTTRKYLAASPRCFIQSSSKDWYRDRERHIFLSSRTAERRLTSMCEWMLCVEIAFNIRFSCQGHFFSKTIMKLSYVSIKLKQVPIQPLLWPLFLSSTHRKLQHECTFTALGLGSNAPSVGVGEGTGQSYSALTCSKRSAKHYPREEEKVQGGICKQEIRITTFLTAAFGMGRFVPRPLLTALLEGTAWLLCMGAIPRLTGNGRNGHRLYPARHNGLVTCQKQARWKN